MQISEEQKEKLKKLASDFEKKHTPLPGNKCVSCGGSVVKKARGLANGKFFYDLPKCSGCNRTYFRAYDVPTCGEEEFLEALSVPMTI